MAERKKLIVILGPTASGKSNLAVELALRLTKSGTPVEIISADSRQVYTSLDIGTGKISHKEMMGIPHHLLDVCSPLSGRVFTVAEFQRRAHAAIAAMHARGMVPILVGGTGFYIQAVVDNIELPEVPPNKKLRAKLEKQSTEKLFETLKKLDLKRARGIDAFNRPRLIRAIEIATAIGAVPAVKARPLYDVLQIGIATDEKTLRARIHDRLLARMKKGMLNEVKKLHTRGLSYKRMYELGLEYRHLALFLRNVQAAKKTKNTANKKAAVRTTQTKMPTSTLALLEQEIWHYAKRQMTWFKRDKRIQWFTLSEKAVIKKVVKEFSKK